MGQRSPCIRPRGAQRGAVLSWSPFFLSFTPSEAPVQGGLWQVLNPRFLDIHCRRCKQSDRINKSRFNEQNKGLLVTLRRAGEDSHSKYGYKVLSSQ
ncbi:hypothetical protein U0070_014150 [Myodes glareolus]|uniref:Uncharacterized protein n=1 Tax=Myodes glareolus TaxID=447135 RepID=A0AAW0JDQ2_MYOGA